MRKKITMIVIIVLVIAILATSIIAISEARKMNRKTTRNHVIAITNWLTTEHSQSSDLIHDAKMLIDHHVARDIPLRVTLIRTAGEVIYDSEAEDLESHLTRPEVQKVLKTGQPAEEIRYSKTLEYDLYYYAALIVDSDIIVRIAYPLSLEDDTVRSVRTHVLLIGLISILLMGAVLAFAIQKISQPLETITESFERLAGGITATRIEESHQVYPEVRRLSASYNRMADTLEEQQASLKQKQSFLDALIGNLASPIVVIDERADVIFINERGMQTFRRFIDPVKHPYPLFLLTHDEEISERAIALISGQTQDRELVKTLTTSEGTRSYHLTLSPLHERRVAILFHDRTAEAEAALLRSDFVANVTHELRTPLTSIRGMIDTLRSGRVMSQEQADRFLQLMEVESERLERLVSDLLILSDIEQSPIKLNEDYFDLTELANEVITQLEPYASEESVTLKLSQSDRFHVSANRDRVKQLIMNLLDNGIKYNRPGGTVTLSWSAFDIRETSDDRQNLSRLTFSVEDDGVGISESDQSRIFERFYRVDRSRSQEPRGTGLGLAIVKHIALLYNGDVSVQSRLGIGTIIHASLLVPVEKQE
ncbi:MAG TPA: hypothetical protein GX728_00430 [Clostridiaceae bacterium]|nr:hypothetical protein [Clostridiaceae bacterium]